MAKGFISTFLKVAAVAALVPYKVQIVKDGDKIKRISAKSLAAHITYTPGDDEKKSDLSVMVPGFFGKDGFDMGIEVMENAAECYDDIAEDEELFADLEDGCIQAD